MILLDAAGNSGFWDALIHFDQKVFRLINGDLTNPVFDAILPYTRESVIWVPFYLFLFIFVVMNFGKKGLGWIIFALLTAALTDMISSSFLKEYIGRVRPCRDPEFSQYVRFLVKHCPVSGSFTSSHAANHFGAAMFGYMTLKSVTKWAWLFFAWAGIICYAQIYVGVHYPGDILGGALVGCIIGWFSAGFFNRRIGLRTFGQLSEQS